MADKQVRKSTTAEASSLLVPSLPLSLPALRSRVITGEELELQLRGPRGSVPSIDLLCVSIRLVQFRFSPTASMPRWYGEKAHCTSGLSIRLVLGSTVFFLKKKLQFFPQPPLLSFSHLYRSLFKYRIHESPPLFFVQLMSMHVF